MFQVSVEESFAAGHALRGYRGKCENVHGHNYKVRITLEGPALDSVGLLRDFKELKEAMQSAIRKLDHRFLNEIPPFDEVNPSAENLARFFYVEISQLLADPHRPIENAASEGAPCRVQAVTVWETDTTTATYFHENSGVAGSNPQP